MNQKFRDWKPTNAVRQLLSRVDQIINQYQAAGYKLTLRQLYYQLVARDIIPNTLQSYTKLGTMLVNARMAGLVDWDAIEDRVRRPQRNPEWEDIEEFMDSVIPQFRIKRHSGQEHHVELWTEKDALTSILKPITDEYHAYLMVNRGYSSASAMYAAANRLRHYQDLWGQQPILLYLGDHDPSGLDMDRDIRDRLAEFGVDVNIIRIGLTKDQINQYNPPPNPAKITDPRANNYIAQYGPLSWEVDALEPNVLDALVRTKIEEHMDVDKYNDQIAKEDNLKTMLKQHIEVLMKKMKKKNKRV